ncbi:MAG: T9SS type A sorting domain-containing protein, partial [Ignavibacteriaceae bacterium]|nr:T9SS type A sorting domain-containing protein [Ignavibacteriaceae bacterium]
VWITTSTSEYLQTKDGGKNWELKEIEGEDYLKSIFFVNKEVGYAIAGLGKIYSTKNGGDTWEAYDSTYDYSFQDIYFIDENNGWIVGYIVSSETKGKGIILHTSDGGKTWETQFEKEVFERSMLIFFASIQMKDENMGWAISPEQLDVMANTRVFRTIDSGKNWIETNTPIHYMAHKLRIANNDTLWAGGRFIGIFTASSNGGETWQNSDSWVYQYVSSMSPYSGKIGWMTAQKNIGDSTSQLYFTKDMGVTWIQEIEIIGKIRDIENKDGYLWMVGYNGLIMRKKIDFTTSVEKQEELPASFEVYQNYPNPFNPTTTIEYNLPTEGNVKLEVYNSLGQLVNVLIEGNQSAGRNKVTWNGKDSYGNSVSSGIYFYRIKTNSFSQVRKMILMK